MDSWSAIQLKKMQAGGNADLNAFLKVGASITQVHAHKNEPHLRHTGKNQKKKKKTKFFRLN